ncbi:tRNA1Val (adenine37-N6)-methyltransferase [Dyadobacter jejuensis]|uniref:tRNA1(Val) (adenine(37)-N6)-methyltransferase n=1 Tax=Dyadobacter jejuensis TaxID=1082580 RepID=A0A316AG77_9BACT|nr:methyltransferase [Dyadobacter jejuensis]PWJ56795.1 tRNA1Val (adenine37-N6)-methyltransferase [Dyadobacter jejuensis]
MGRNNYFEFKQFKVYQDRCPMKVCTDACTFGAWVELPKATRVLDIGSGTGLLSLMVAQRYHEASVMGIELHRDSYEQSLDNVRLSPFAPRLDIHHGAVQDFDPGGLFDAIITNPPFYQANLRSPNALKNRAHHAETLDFEDLLKSASRLLHPEGTFHILLPYEESLDFEALAKAYGFYPERILRLKDQETKKPFRRLTSYYRGEESSKKVIDNELIVFEGEERSYTDSFRRLLSPFYLIF